MNSILEVDPCLQFFMPAPSLKPVLRELWLAHSRLVSAVDYQGTMPLNRVTVLKHLGSDNPTDADLVASETCDLHRQWAGR